jgi:dGTPase
VKTEEQEFEGGVMRMSVPTPEWACQTSVGRLTPEPPDRIRNEFQRDRDRIIHAKAFRRLMHKTQVFISPDGDHFRTRLTHTLEMMQISRTIARSLDLNEDLTEAIALGHDLGHTPFGHTGEEAFARVLVPHKRGFMHNEHSLRVVDVLEKDRRGLNLTHEVRDGILNHTGEGHPATREGEIVRIADRIAYVNHDVDDALRAGVISWGALPKEPLRVLGEGMSARIDTMVRDMILTSSERGEIALSEAVYGALMELRTWLFRNVYHNPRSRENQKAGNVVAALFDYYLQRPEERAKSDPDPVTETIDFVAGMTDRYALATYKRLFLPRSDTIFSGQEKQKADGQ